MKKSKLIFCFSLVMYANSIVAQNYEETTIEHPVDMTSMIVNPRFDNNDVATGWSGTEFGN